MGDYQTYGLKDGKLIHISKVQSGLACGCICPNCKATLIARKGEKNKHTFAHRSKAESCGGGQETALHLMAKDIIANQRTVYIPPEGKERQGGINHFDSVALEARDYDGIIPDIIARDGAVTLNIEIRVNHAVDAEKRSKLKAANLRTIEIDLHDLLDDFSEETVAEALLSDERSIWVYSPIIEKEERALRARNALCDYIPCEGQHLSWGKKVYCPMTKQPIWTMRGSDCCYHACNYFDYQQDGRTGAEPLDDEAGPIPCRYREKDIPLELVDDIMNIERKSGSIVSVDVLCRNVWEHWGGFGNGLLSRDFHIVPPSSSGKTIKDLWNSHYKWMVIENIESKEKMFIPGEEGFLKRHEYFPYGEILGRYADSPNKRLHIIWRAEEPIWLLVKKLDLEPKVSTPPTIRSTLSPNQSICRKSIEDSAYLLTKSHSSDQVTIGSGKQKTTVALKKDELQTSIPTDTHLREQQTSEQTISLNQRRPASTVYELARCTICNYIKNILQFAKVEGDGMYKTGICKECDRKSK